MSSTHARRQRRAARGAALPTLPGVYMALTLHDDHCKAPLVPCSCAPSTRYERIETPADYERVRDQERRWTADVRARLD